MMQSGSTNQNSHIQTKSTIQPQEEHKKAESSAQIDISSNVEPQESEHDAFKEDDSQKKLDETIGYLNKLDDEKVDRLNAEMEKN